MESFENSNRHSMSDSFSLYERYMRSFNVVDSYIDPDCDHQPNQYLSNHFPCDNSNSEGGNNIDLSAVQTNANEDKHSGSADENNCFLPNLSNNLVDKDSFSSDLEVKTDSHGASEETKLHFKQPVFITSTMENSNNAVDSVPLFANIRHNENIFKLPIRELSFNGTIIKHVQKLKPIVDPITALSTSTELVNLDDKSNDNLSEDLSSNNNSEQTSDNNVDHRESDISEDKSSTETNRIDKYYESTGDTQYDENNKKNVDGCSTKWSEQSYSSLEASFDSGVRSPDMFSEDEVDSTPTQEPLWKFIKDYEAYDKRRVKKIEETLQGIPPPPSVTTLKTDVTEMLKKYYCFLPAFNDEVKADPESNSTTPLKKVSFVQIPEALPEDAQSGNECQRLNTSSNNTSLDKSVEIKMCSESEAKQSSWPDVLKCKYYDIYYNITNYSEKFELLSLRFGERYVGAETDTSVNVHSGGLQSPNSASKRKALRLKMAQAKSPGRRLSHLARRRQAFCSAATIGEKAQTSSKMVLIDKNYFPHRKLVNTSERRSPRCKRTPGKKTPTRKTPCKTPRSGSSRKKAMRRLLMDPENLSRSQPTRETLKRALFLSPENRKPIPVVPSTSMPPEAMKSKRCLFGSPTAAETKSSDGTQSDTFLKRKRDPFDDDQVDNGRSKIAKSLSFGGDSIGRHSFSQTFSRRASESFPKTMADLNEMHKKKLLWAVTEALRLHGWRMCSPGFREKASSLARLTRRLLTLPIHAAKLAAPKLSTSETMLKLARQYVFAIIQGRTVDDCFQEEQTKLANEANSKISGYISATMYQQIKAKQATSTLTSQIKENTFKDNPIKQDQSRSASKNVLQDKTVNIDANSNSSSGLSALDNIGVFKSNSLPSFEEAAKLRARRQISFDTVEFPKS